LNRLVTLGLTGMAKAFDEQQRQPDIAALGFEERFALLVDREATERENKRLVNRLRFAKLRQNAVVEDIDMKALRGLDKALFQKLVASEWIERHQNLLIVGPTESDSYCPPRYAIRMPSHFDADRETPAVDYVVHPQCA
jgi:DNA replication protein DnaC